MRALAMMLLLGQATPELWLHNSSTTADVLIGPQGDPNCSAIWIGYEPNSATAQNYAMIGCTSTGASYLNAPATATVGFRMQDANIFACNTQVCVAGSATYPNVPIWLSGAPAVAQSGLNGAPLGVAQPFTEDGVIQVTGSSGSASLLHGFASPPVCQITPASDVACRWWVTSSVGSVSVNLHSTGVASFNYHCTGS